MFLHWDISLQSGKDVHIIGYNFNEMEFRVYIQIINNLHMPLSDVEMFNLIFIGVVWLGYTLCVILK